MKEVCGIYNELWYKVILYDPDKPAGDAEISMGGNSPYSATEYLPYGEGVGRAEMRRICAIMARDFAHDNGLKFTGIAYEDPETGERTDD